MSAAVIEGSIFVFMSNRRKAELLAEFILQETSIQSRSKEILSESVCTIGSSGGWNGWDICDSEF